MIFVGRGNNVDRSQVWRMAQDMYELQIPDLPQMIHRVVYKCENIVMIMAVVIRYTDDGLCQTFFTVWTLVVGIDRMDGHLFMVPMAD